jgi:hypothetical protein
MLVRTAEAGPNLVWVRGTVTCWQMRGPPSRRDRYGSDRDYGCSHGYGHNTTRPWLRLVGVLASANRRILSDKTAIAPSRSAHRSQRQRSITRLKRSSGGVEDPRQDLG